MNRIPFGFGPATAAGGTAFIQGIIPYPGAAPGAPLLYAQVPGNNGNSPNWWGAGSNSVFTVVDRIQYSTNGIAQKVGLLQPLNFAYVTTAVAINTATFILDKDPGVYSTNYRYRLNNSNVPASVANNAIAAGDYVAYQLVDGTWIFDTVASGTYAALVLTTNVPNISGGGVNAGAPMFFFGVVGDKNPANGQVPFQTTIPVYGTAGSVTGSSQNQEIYSQWTGLWQSIHPGDPVIFYSPNTTTAGTLDMVTGYYQNNP